MLETFTGGGHFDNSRPRATDACSKAPHHHGRSVWYRSRFTLTCGSRRTSCCAPNDADPAFGRYHASPALRPRPRSRSTTLQVRTRWSDRARSRLRRPSGVKGPPIAAQVLERVAVIIQRARTVPDELQPAVVTMLEQRADWPRFMRVWSSIAVQDKVGSALVLYSA